MVELVLILSGCFLAGRVSQGLWGRWQRGR